jgi:hypothetical protein
MPNNGCARGVGGLDVPRKGDVVIPPRGHGPGEVGGHVGMATGRLRINPQTGEPEVEIISGNRGPGHDVRTDWVPESSTMVRRGYAPAVPEIAPAEGGAAGPQGAAAPLGER